MLKNLLSSFCLCFVCVASAAPAIASPAVLQETKIYRKKNETVRDVVKITAAQKKKLDKIDAQFNAKLERVLKDESAPDYFERRDKINAEYTRAILKILTTAQRKSYMAFMKKRKADFLADHPDAHPDDVFIWGGAEVAAK